MSKTVFKFPVPRDNTGTLIDVPLGSKVLHGDYQQHADGLFVWVEIDTDEKTREVREVICLGTGRLLPPMEIGTTEWRFVNTFLMHEHRLVFHVYERQAL